MTASLNPYISQFGEKFDAEKSSQYRLTIQFSLGGLSFALLDATTQTLIALECYQSDLLTDSDDLFRALERALESKGLNNKVFQSVTSLIDNRDRMLARRRSQSHLVDEPCLPHVFIVQMPKHGAVRRPMGKVESHSGDAPVQLPWNKYCGPLYPSIDHIIAMVNGGGHIWSNVQLAHMMCNSEKGDSI